MSLPSNQAIIEELRHWRETGATLLEVNAEENNTYTKPRRFKGAELAKLVGVLNVQSIYKAEANGSLPAHFKDERNRNRGYTLEMALQAMDVFGTRPSRSEEESPALLSFTNFKGGCWKTTCAWHFGMCGATKGLRVLMVDLDPQGTLTRSLGIRPDYDVDSDDTLAPFLNGEIKQPTRDIVKTRIKKTHICTLDLLPASLALQGVEWALATEVNGHAHNQSLPAEERIRRMTECFMRVANCLALVAEDYDLVIADGTPTLGMLPLNIVFASHAVVVPVPTHMADFASTMSFIELLEDSFETVNQQFGDRIELPELHFLPTKFDSGINTLASQNVLEKYIVRTFGERVFRHAICNHKSAVGAASYFSRTMFEVNATELPVKTEARKRCMRNYEDSFQEIMQRLVLPYWPSQLSRGG